MDDRQKKKVLIVDDDATDRKLLTEILKDDYRLFVAVNAEEALERSGNKENMPDIILLDIFLPDKHGDQVCRDLKLNKDTWYIPVIFITENANNFFKKKWLESGGVDFILKPIDSDSVKTRIKIQLEINSNLRTYHKGLIDLNGWSRAIQAQMQDILKEQQELITGLESIMKIPYPGKS